MNLFRFLNVYCISEILLLALSHYIHLPLVQLKPKALPLGK